MSRFCLPGVRDVVSVACSVVVLAETCRAAVDGSFNTSVNGSIQTIAVQSDGKILVGGNFNAVNGVARSNLARLNADGSLDNGFAGGPAQAVYRVEVVGSKVFVGAADGLRRYDVDGTLDWSYPMQVKTFAVDSQQRVLIGGQFSRVENAPHRNLARLTAAGTLDSSFTAQIGCCAGEGVFALLTRGENLLAAGAFQSVNGIPAENIAMLDGAGALQSGFAASAPPNVLALVAAQDGGFLRVNDRSVARHLASGATDGNFAPVELFSPDERFLAAATQPDGRVIIGGLFGSANVLRVNSDGTVDDDFGVATDGTVQAVAIAADGSVMLGGSFATVNGATHSGIAKIPSTGTASSAPTLRVALGLGEIKLSWSAVPGSFVLETKALADESWSPVSATISSANGVDSTALPVNSVGKLFRLRANR